MQKNDIIEQATEILHIKTKDTLSLMVSQIAANWCSSFGVTNSDAQSRLVSGILHQIIENKNNENILDIYNTIDHYAEIIILKWFENIQPYLSDDEPSNINLLRYSFLQTNADGTYSEQFLLEQAQFEVLGTLMSTHHLSSTPNLKHREMKRQII